jgi:hypothetical protein
VAWLADQCERVVSFCNWRAERLLKRAEKQMARSKRWQAWAKTWRAWGDWLNS